MLAPLKWPHFDKGLQEFIEMKFPDWIPYGRYSEWEFALHLHNFFDREKNYRTMWQVIYALRKRGLATDGFVTIKKEVQNECCA